MSCKYCNDTNHYLLSAEFIHMSIFSMLGESKITGNEALDHEESYSVHIDRGYLRLSQDDDDQCLDHGEKIKINFCPVCGEWLTNPDKEEMV